MVDGSFFDAALFDIALFDNQSLQAFFTQFHFIRPYWLLALLPLCAVVYWRWREDSQPRWQSILPDHLRRALTVGDQGWRKQLPLKVLALIMTLAIVVCAGPTWQRQASPFGEDKASMLVVLDNSESMLQTDLPPSRLERSKQKIRDLLALRDGGKAGLVVYAGTAHIAMPVTQDSRVFAPFLAAIVPDIMPVEGKAAEQALPLIADQLQAAPGSTVLLVTDGGSQRTIDAYGEYFANNPYQLLILAAGNPDVASPDPVDMKALEALASASNGRIVTVTVDSSDVEALNRYIERNMQLNGESAMPWKDMGYGLLLPIALILLLWFRRGWLVQWSWVAMVSLSLLLSAVFSASLLYAPAVNAQPVEMKAKQTDPVETLTALDKATQWWWDLWLTPDQQGQRLFNHNEYLAAGQHFEDPLRKGIAYYYAGEFKLAHTAFIQVDSDRGQYYAASALARQREYVAARDLLKTLLDKPGLDPALKSDVAHNYRVLSGIVDDINQFSESQAGSSDGPEQSFELGDEPQTAEGADEKTSAELMVKAHLSASELLGSDDLADKWLKRVEADPKYFLKAKFQLQLLDRDQQADSNTAGDPNDGGDP
ncbi:VWA domain-containing protein [Photobacterium japonica]|uniref:vWA domain-containing protein n=1 Tax=Photobacterium japonica TaxID=2910235 RepID=UPI003D1010A2